MILRNGATRFGLKVQGVWFPLFAFFKINSFCLIKTCIKQYQIQIAMKSKTIQKLFLIITLVLVVLTGCKKDEKKADDPKPVKPDPATVTDIEGNSYKTVRIGTQLWMAENLRVTSFNDGTPIPTSDPPDKDITGNLIVTYQWITMWDSTLLEDLGRVYSYGVGSHPMKNVCPEGWRVPKRQDWIILSQFLGGTDFRLSGGHVLMEENSQYWEPKTLITAEDPNNETGFTARGGGQRHPVGTWYRYKKDAWFMMSDQTSGFNIDHASTYASPGSVPGSAIKHIRCIME
jgi:uncharacterized protein (TIGR02145 family)